MTLPTTQELVAQLRKRAKSERETQANNEAVATALIGQKLLWEQGIGAHNVFAVRTQLEYARAAKIDAALASDWDAAADALEALAARVVALEGHLSKCLDLLDVALEDHGKGKDWGEEDAFRMGEMFGREDIAAVQAARAKLEERG